jgi:hypothetical protein
MTVPSDIKSVEFVVEVEDKSAKCLATKPSTPAITTETLELAKTSDIIRRT